MKWPYKLWTRLFYKPCIKCPHYEKDKEIDWGSITDWCNKINQSLNHINISESIHENCPLRGGKMILILHDKIPSWNELYSQKHWSKRYGMANDWKTKMFYQCKAQGLQPVKTYPITLEITSNQRCDLDNLCIKLVIDGLKLAGIIDDDDPKHIDMITIIHDKTQEYTTVELHEYA